MKKSKLKEALVKELDLIIESEASDWDTLYNWLKTFSTDNGTFLVQNNINNGSWLKKQLDNNAVTIDELDTIAENPSGQVMSDLPLYKRLTTKTEQTGTGAIGVGAGPISTPKWVMPKGEKTNPGTKAMEKLGFKKIVQEIVREQLKSYKQSKYVK